MNFSKISLRAIVAVVAGILILGFLNWSIFQKESIVQKGRIVLLQLAPVDPRSLMQGDYMALRFALANKVSSEVSRDEMIVLKLDENNVANFERIDDGHSALQDDEIRFRYRLPNAFFFEEGQGKAYELARYGEFRVTDSGNATLTQMRDEGFNVMGRGVARD
ncbi:MAG: GDYXXLXY domain-containing protein [Betaproteobacteria bacterium]|nr:GDYXXLXY domain-containing protein [Betaproteobacteria bacterium]